MFLCLGISCFSSSFFFFSVLRTLFLFLYYFVFLYFLPTRTSLIIFVLFINTSLSLCPLLSCSFHLTMFVYDNFIIGLQVICCSGTCSSPSNISYQRMWTQLDSEWIRSIQFHLFVDKYNQTGQWAVHHHQNQYLNHAITKNILL